MFVSKVNAIMPHSHNLMQARKTVLAQNNSSTNIAFKGFLEDDLSEYAKYIGEEPPEIEIKKFHLSEQVANHLKKQEYDEALVKKALLYKICKTQRKFGDAQMLMQSIKKLALLA